MTVLGGMVNMTRPRVDYGAPGSRDSCSVNVVGECNALLMFVCPLYTESQRFCAYLLNLKQRHCSLKPCATGMIALQVQCQLGKAHRITSILSEGANSPVS